jgi:hypothetical protein
MKKVYVLLLLVIGAGSLGTASSMASQGPKIDSAKIIAQLRIKLDSSLKAKCKDFKTDSAASRAKGDEKVKNSQPAPPSVKARCDNAEGGFFPVLGWILIGTIVLFFIYAAKTKDLLRGAIINPETFMAAARATPRYRDTENIADVKKPYSLYRTQLGLWTVVISCSYIYLQLCKYFPIQLIPVDGSLLMLMGISAGTAVAGSIIDNNAAPEQQGLVRPSEGFFNDILSDQNGINVHRFQNVLWTAIAVVIYLSQIPDIGCGKLPALDNTLIALTGISSATYLGLKVNENKPPAIG